MTITGIVNVSDGHHGFVEEAVTVAQRAPASVESLSGRELERAQQVDPRTTHLVRMRFRTGIRAGQTVTYHDGRNGDRGFEIVAPPLDPDERHRELHLMCKEAIV